MPKPIFVLGVPRSGTTWTANLLCLHSKIAGVQAKRHEGIHESHFFSYIENRFGNIQNDNNFIEFIEAFSSSDYFILSNIDKNYFYKKKPSSYNDFFKILMDKFAEKQKADFWIEKSPAHSVYAKELLKYFPNAKFIVVKRNIIDTIKSEIRSRYLDENMEKSMKVSKFLFITYLIFRYHMYYKYIKFHHEKLKYLLIQYENLKQDKLNSTKKICRYLKLDFEQRLLEDKYKPNTGFKSKEERKDVLKETEEIFIKIMDKFMMMLPYHFFKIFIHVYKEKFKKSEIPDWFYTFKKDMLNSSLKRP